MDSISFIVITNYKKPREFSMCLNSVIYQANQFEKSQIIVSGDPPGNLNPGPEENFVLVKRPDLAQQGMTAAMRNVGASNATGDILVFCDDDIVFPFEWHENFKAFVKNNPDFGVLGHRILLPDGKRFWDKAVFRPVEEGPFKGLIRDQRDHFLVDYDDESHNHELCQTGGLWIIHRQLWVSEPWPFQKVIRDPLPGDYTYSKRMHDRGEKFVFDKTNYVWHFDLKYYRSGQEIYEFTSLITGLKEDYIDKEGS